MEGIPSSLEDLAGKQVLSLLLALLPGLIASEIIYALTVREKKEIVDRVIHALVHTFAIYVIWQCVVGAWNLWVATVWRMNYGTGSSAWVPNASASLIGLAICAIAWGLLGAWVINSECIHSALQRIGMTASSSHPNQWYTAFYSTRGQRYVTIHLKDGRRIFGWPKLWPNDPNYGHLYIMDAEWLDRDDRGIHQTSINILIDVTTVSYIEFVPLLEQEGNANGQQANVEKQPAASPDAISGGEEQGRSELRSADGSATDAAAGTAEACQLKSEVGEVKSA